jgi:hypothetical protein
MQNERDKTFQAETLQAGGGSRQSVFYVRILGD